MNEENIINPFKQRRNWAEKARNKIKVDEYKSQKLDSFIKEEKKEIKRKVQAVKIKSRVAKSFKIYPGKIPRDFDKRVNKLQVYFDDLEFDKYYVDSGKYIMFLMQLSEKFNLYELYKEVDENGEFDLNLNKLKKFIQNK